MPREALAPGDIFSCRVTFAEREVLPRTPCVLATNQFWGRDVRRAARSQRASLFISFQGQKVTIGFKKERARERERRPESRPNAQTRLSRTPFSEDGEGCFHVFLLRRAGGVQTQAGPPHGEAPCPSLHSWPCSWRAGPGGVLRPEAGNWGALPEAGNWSVFWGTAFVGEPTLFSGLSGMDCFSPRTTFKSEGGTGSTKAAFNRKTGPLGAARGELDAAGQGSGFWGLGVQSGPERRTRAPGPPKRV